MAANPASLQVQEEAAAVKENLDINQPNLKYCFLNRNEQGKTMLSILNPDSGDGEGGREGDLVYEEPDRTPIATFQYV